MEQKEFLEKFLKMLNLNLEDKTETKKNGSTELKYLSWAYAAAQMTKEYPDWTYEIKTFISKDGVELPYMHDENTGYMVATEITTGGITKEMWLPVMDGANKAMKSKPYTYKTKTSEKTVQSATMFDINTAIMRCLVKNIGMFGIGLYIYAGEDLPQDMDIISDEEKNKNILDLKDLINSCQTNDELKQIYKVHKKELCSNKELFNLLTETGNKLKTNEKVA